MGGTTTSNAGSSSSSSAQSSPTSHGSGNQKHQKQDDQHILVPLDQLHEVMGLHDPRCAATMYERLCAKQDAAEAAAARNGTMGGR